MRVPEPAAKTTADQAGEEEEFKDVFLVMETP
jgi:hypothetical protein